MWLSLAMRNIGRLETLVWLLGVLNLVVDPLSVLTKGFIRKILGIDGVHCSVSCHSIYHAIVIHSTLHVEVRVSRVR